MTVTATPPNTLSAAVRNLPRGFLKLDPSEVTSFSTRVRTAFRRGGVETIADLLDIDDASVHAWPRCGEKTGSAVRAEMAALCKRLEASGLADQHSLSAQTLLKRLTAEDPLMVGLRNRMGRLSAKERRIVEGRFMIAGARSTLQQLGDKLGVTRERVRQVESVLVGRADPDGWLGPIIDERLAVLRKGRTEPLLISDIEKGDPWFAGISEKPRVLGGILATLHCDHRMIDADSINEPCVTSADAALKGALTWRFTRWFRRQGIVSAIEPKALEYLGGLGAPEMLPLLIANVAPWIEGPNGWIPGPTLYQWVNATVWESEVPLHVADVEQILHKKGVNLAQRTVRSCFDRAPFICTANSTYIHPVHLQKWDKHAPAVKAIALGAMKTGTKSQWLTWEIHRLVQEESGKWAADMPFYVIDYLLGTMPETFQRLKRFSWGRKGQVAEKRLSVSEAGRQALEEAGEPMRFRDLEQRIREMRGLGLTLSIRWPLVRLGGGLTGLGPRDLKLSNEEFKALRAAAEVILYKKGGSGRLNAGQLERLLARVCPKAPKIPGALIVSMLHIQPKVAIDVEGEAIRRSDIKRRGPKLRGPMDREHTTWRKFQNR